MFMCVSVLKLVKTIFKLTFTLSNAIGYLLFNTKHLEPFTIIAFTIPKLLLFLLRINEITSKDQECNCKLSGLNLLKTSKRKINFLLFVERF